MEYITYKKEYPPELAQEAYEKGFYIEAIQIVHAWMESQVRELIMLVGAVNFGATLSETWDVAAEISFLDTVKVLFVLGQFTAEEFTRFRGLNSLRNKIIHQVYREPYEKEYKGVPKRHYDEVFRKSLEDGHLVEKKCISLALKTGNDASNQTGDWG